MNGKWNKYRRKRVKKVCLIAIIVIGILFLSEKTTEYKLISMGTYWIKCNVARAHDFFSGVGIRAGMQNDVEIASKTYISYIDDDLLSEYYADGGQFVYVTNDEIEKIRRNANSATVLSSSAKEKLKILLGCYEQETKKIYINLCKENKYSSTVVHEFAHYLDQKYNFSSDIEFKNVADKEQKQFALFDAEVEIDREEYFAAAYAAYLTQPHFLKMAAPDTYSYMEKLIKNI